MAGARSGTTAATSKTGARSVALSRKAPQKMTTTAEMTAGGHGARPAAKLKMRKAVVSKAVRAAKATPVAPKGQAARRQMGYLVPRRIQRAYDALVQDQVAKGSPDLRVSVRVDPGILEAAARNLGLTQPSDVVNAAIIAAAAQDPFKTWFLTAAGTLPEEFELPV